MTADPVGGALVSLRERRTQVIAALSHAFSRDAFEVEELERRMEAAQRALTVAELDALIVDVEPKALVPQVRSLTGANVGGDERPAQQTVVTMFGGLDRSGRWIVPRLLKVHCVAGGASLDFREADLGPGVTEVWVTCVAGGVDIIVPPNVAVDLAASAIAGGFDQSHRGLDGMGAEPVATLRITGVCIAGGVDVQTRRVGESAREARKRIKQEQKQLASGVARGQAALPAAVVLPPKKR